jgi:hypothetical protein
MAYDKGTKTISAALHPNQVSVIERLEQEGRRLNCQSYEVRLNLAKKMRDEFLEMYTTSDVYKEANAIGKTEKLMRYVSATAFIQAQAIVSEIYPTHNLSGDRTTQAFAWNYDIAPHLSSGEDRLRLARLVYEDGKRLSGIEINVPSVVKKWVGLVVHDGNDAMWQNDVKTGDDFL